MGVSASGNSSCQPEAKSDASSSIGCRQRTQMDEDNATCHSVSVLVGTIARSAGREGCDRQA